MQGVGVINSLALVMPMAGRGSRFSEAGAALPKPLIELEGRPFFWWAVESVRRAVQVNEIVFVVLAEHCSAFAIDERILSYYPAATIVRIPGVTSGAAETAKLGLSKLAGNGPVAINDCDHAFVAPNLPQLVNALVSGAAGGLLCFRSDSPAYSYVKLDQHGEISGTVEKKVASPFAIAGCYFFANRDTFFDHYTDYSETCPYNELFTSGLFDLMAQRGRRIAKAEAHRHYAFGTPKEQERLDVASLRHDFNLD